MSGFIERHSSVIVWGIFIFATAYWHTNGTYGFEDSVLAILSAIAILLAFILDLLKRET